jgi:hypothetical protein
VLGAAQRDGTSLAEVLEGAGLMARTEVEAVLANPISAADSASVRAVADRVGGLVG